MLNPTSHPCPVKRSQHLGPHVLLVLIASPHLLDDLLASLLTHTSLLRNDGAKHLVHLPRHIRSITTDVEIGLLLEEFVDLVCVLLQAVLDIDFVGLLAGEGRYELKSIAQDSFGLLRGGSVGA